MLRTMLKSTIQRATVTASVTASGTDDARGAGVAGPAEPGGFGLCSVTIDEDLLDAADLLPGEQVSVVDTNGARLQSIVVAGERGSGVLAVGGPAARLLATGEQVAVLSYAAMDDAAARAHRPRIVRVDAANRPLAPGAPAAAATAATAATAESAETAETDDAARLDALIQAEA